MATPGARRSVSIKTETLWRLRQMTNADEVSDSSFLEAMIDARADERGIPKLTRDEAIADLPKAQPRKDKLSNEVVTIASQHFSF